MFNPPHPGAFIRETIEGLREETGQALPFEEVANGLGITRSTLQRILAGKQSITADMAVRLGKAFGPNDEFWMLAQERYDMAAARKRVDTSQVRIFWESRPAA